MFEDGDFDDELENVQKNVQKLALIKELVQHPGWKIVQDHFNKEINTIGHELDMEEDLTKLPRLQERKRAFRSMLEVVSGFCQEHDEASIRLDNMGKEKQERDQYGQ